MGDSVGQHSRASPKRRAEDRREVAATSTARSTRWSRTRPRSRARSARTCAASCPRWSCRASSRRSTATVALRCRLPRSSSRRAGRRRAAARAVRAAGAAGAARGRWTAARRGADRAAAAPRAGGRRGAGRRHGPATRRSPWRAAQLRDGTRRTPRSTPGSRSSAPRRWSPSTPRPTASTTCVRDRRACRSRRAGRGRLRAARARLAGRARSSCRETGARARSSRCSRTPRCAKLGHHLKFDAHMLANYGIRFAASATTRCSSRTCSNSVATPPRHGLDRASATWASRPSVSRTSPARARSRSTFNQVDVERAAEYAGRGRRRHAAAAPGALAAARGAAALAEAVRDDRAAAAAGAVPHGAHRRAGRSRAAASAERGARGAHGRARGAGARARPAGRSTSSRPSSCRRSCSSKLRIPVLRKTPTGQPSTAEDVLEELAANYALPRLILEYRGVAKLKSHLHRQAAGADQPRDRPHPYVLSPGGGGDRPPVVAPIRTCRTSRSARPRGGASARRSSRRPAACWWRPTIRRSSCASWRTCRAMRACCRRLPRTATCTRRPPRRCSACRWTRSAPISAAPPRRSTSG